MKPELPDPISNVLEDTAGEVRIQRMWRAIEAREGRRSARARWVASGVVVAAAAAIALFFVTRPAPPGAVRLASGVPLEAHEGASELLLDDGSRIVLSEGARLETLRNDASALALLLARGRARFEVEPGGPRTWSIETGVATVEVVGTVFTITRGSGWAEIEVERGVVMVRGEQVPERAVRLTRGRSIRVGAWPVRRAEVEAPHDIAPASALAAPADLAIETPARRASSEPRSLRAAAATEHGPDERENIEDANAWMARADVARRAGQPEEAAALLERAMARSDDPAAGVAAFTLGRLELDVLHRPDRAARAFERALELALPPRLREDAAARRVEALAQTGDRAATRAAADRYLRDHPAGRHAARVRELSSR